MNICCYADVHLCPYSSIIRSRGEVFSTRVENCIKSINWAEDIAKDCDLTVCLGDAIDTSDVNAEVVTAVTTIKWNNTPHVFLAGNHEMAMNHHQFSSAYVFSNENIKIVDTPQRETYGNLDIYYIPYILTKNMLPLSEYIENNDHKKIIFSHNNVAGIQMGAFLSTDGFETDDIDNLCDLFVNGHLHNGTQFSKHGYNLGNLTGQNFSEDAFKYRHGVFIINTDEMTVKFIENPYAFNFYKMHIDKVTKLKFNELKDNAVVSIQVCPDRYEEVLNEILGCSKIIEHRLLIERASKEQEDKEETKVEINAVNYLDMFEKCILNLVGTDDIVKYEIGEIVHPHEYQV